MALKSYVAVAKGEPLKAALSNELGRERRLGGQERRFAAAALRGVLKHQRLVDALAKALGHAPGTWALEEDRALVRYVLWRRWMTGARWLRIRSEAALPGPLRPRSIQDRVLETICEAPWPPLGNDAARSALRCSFPEWLADGIQRAVGASRVEGVLTALNAEPPLILRSRGMEAAQAVLRLADEMIDASALSEDPNALQIVGSGAAIFESRLFKSGALQVQDLGSQLIARTCLAPSESGPLRVADICAGAGGKTLALADALAGRGQVRSSDKSERRLQEGKRRVREARVTNVLFGPRDVRGADVVLIDAPCSGTGALAREPEQKWRLTPKKIDDLVRTQVALIAEVVTELRPGASLVYATCSVLTEENEDVVADALATHRNLELVPLDWLPAQVLSGGMLRTLPDRTPGGGFFAARLRKRN